MVDITTAPLYPKIFHADMKGRFFKVIDSLAFHKRDGKTSFSPKDRKFTIRIVQYDKRGADGKPLQVHFAVDYDDFLLLRNMILTGKLGTHGNKAGYTDYKGSGNDKYTTKFESRVLRLEKQLAKKCQDDASLPKEYMYIVDITNGPGIEKDGGAVMPAKDAAGGKNISFFLTEKEAIKMVESVYLYLIAWMTRNFKEVVFAHDAWDKPAQKNNTTVVESVDTGEVY